MSAKLLCEAASLMRDRAAAARNSTGSSDWFADANGVQSSGGRVSLALRANANHIASWHPLVALAVADWLIVAAVHVESHDCEAHCEPDGCASAVAALAVARAYLGRDQ